MVLKQLLKKIFFVDPYLQQRRISKWISDGHAIPVPHAVNQLVILHYATAYRLKTLVETGTFLGDTVWAQLPNFERIYSIELSKELFERAKQRFRRYPSIGLLHGDSSDKIEEVLRELRTPALFWLDGHYSGGITARGRLECPIYAELNHIFRSDMRHVILIDDARLFVGTNDYPSLKELSDFVRENSSYQIKVENDIIVLLPPDQMG